MKLNRKTILGAVLALPLSLASAWAAAPNLLTYQGRLQESGALVTGNRSIDIVICDLVTGGSDGINCHLSGAQGVAVTNGVFRSTFTLPGPVDLNVGNWFLEVRVGGTALSPRERLTSAPYALQAGNVGAAGVLAGNLGSGIAVTFWGTLGSGVVLNAGQITAGTLGTGVNLPAGNLGTGVLAPSVTLSPGTVGTAVILSAAVDTSKLADAAVTDVKIANVGPGKVTAGNLGSGIAVTFWGTLGSGVVLNAGQITAGTFGTGVQLPPSQILPGVIGSGISVVQAAVTGGGAGGTNVFNVIGGTFTVSVGGRIGIGTTNPLTRLHIQPAAGTESDGGILMASDQQISWGNTNTGPFIDGSVGGGVRLGGGGGNDHMILQADSNVMVSSALSVGTGLVPSARLHVSSPNALSGDTILLVSSGTAVGQGLLVVKGDGAVGVGTNSPSNRLAVVGGGAGPSASILNASAVAGAPGARNMALVAANNRGTEIASDILVAANSTNPANWQRGASPQAAVVFRVQNDGNIFGEAAFNSAGADFSEMLPVEGDRAGLEPGDVLAVGKGGLVGPAAGAYTSAFVGVYSEKPTVVGNSAMVDFREERRRVPVGIMGLVRTKVTLEGGPIREADLLVVSSTPGHAMRGDSAKIKPGTFVGKAMEAFDGPEPGKILILIGGR